MKKFITTILEAAVIVAMIFGFTAAAVNAWDNEYEYNLKKEFDLRYEHRFEEEMDLLNPIYLDSVKAQMPKEFKFADWGYPEFDSEDGHCDFSKADEIEKEDAIIEFALCLMDNTGCDFDVAYGIAKNNFSE